MADPINGSTHAVLVQTEDGWALDLSATGAASDVAALFGWAVLPLPLTRNVDGAAALAFARGTEYGQRYGVETS